MPNYSYSYNPGEEKDTAAEMVQKCANAVGAILRFDREGILHIEPLNNAISEYGYNVTAIAHRAFYECTTITEITIPASVTNIGTKVFYKASNLHTIYYNSLYVSSENNFLNLKHITKVVFGGSYIPNDILNGCTNITEIKINDSVTSIGDSAFYGYKHRNPRFSNQYW